MNAMAIIAIISCATLALACFIMAGIKAASMAEDMIRDLNEDLDNEEHLGI